MDPLWWLVPAGFLAGFIDSIVGGGGVITLPALLATGMPPHAAIATNKVAGTGASGMASWQYARFGHLRPALAVGLFPMAVAMSILGAATVLRLPEDLVLTLVASVILAMVLYVLMQPQFGLKDRFTDLGGWKLPAIAAWVGLATFYDGLLGPGTGTILLFGIVALLGMGFVSAAAHGRVWNFGSNIGALALFAFADVIDWRLGLPMMGATMAGAYLGSHSSMKHGARWIRPLFIAVALLLLGRMVVTVW